ncbi:MAG: segregation/condensation protein A [Candidatus Cloacimonetes bacterium]|nr:segregation/condensation protein A [Candidatus Cloacimonadota bacterium]
MTNYKLQISNKVQNSNDKKYKIKLPIFEGPLDLLLFLIRKHKIDIYDIPIAFMLSEYLKYLSLMERLNISIEGEFIEMAATLIKIKLRSLLPHPVNEEEEDLQAELVSNLVAYQKIKETVELLNNLAEENKYYFYRSIDKDTKKNIQDFAISYNIEQDSGDLYNLIKVLQKYILQHPQEIPQDIALEKFKVEDKIKAIRKILRRNKKILFSDIVQNFNKLEVVTFFLAILELVRMKKITIFQNKQFSEIHISKKK